MHNPGFEPALPVVVIGAGPVGLAAAAQLIVRGEIPIVFEQGSEVGAAVLEWGQVRIFSPWRYCIDPAARSLLEASGWTEPDPDSYPTGRDLVERYLAPLAGLSDFAGVVRLNARVTAITRDGMDRMTTAGRDDQPFEVRVVTAEGSESVPARAIVDASGTWGSPNPLGAAGVPALGEAAARAHIHYGVPDVLGKHRHRFAARRVLVVGRGHSAFNTLIDLVALKELEPRTKIVWATRRRLTNVAFGGGAADALTERGRLGDRVHSLVRDENMDVLEGFAIGQLTVEPEGVRVVARDGRSIVVDELVCAAGFRPDLSLTTELRLALDAIVEAPVSLAPLIDPNLHSCGTVPPHGEAELSIPSGTTTQSA